jgi:hypothetical protein
LWNSPFNKKNTEKYIFITPLKSVFSRRYLFWAEISPADWPELCKASQWAASDSRAVGVFSRCMRGEKRDHPNMAALLL